MLAPAAAAGVPIHRLAATRRDERSTIRFWTRARLRQAASRTALPLGGAPSSSLPRLAPVAQGTPHRVRPMQPSVAQASSDQVGDPTALPFRTVGLLMGRDPTGLFGCSATVVASPNASVILTAGHCVKDPFWTRQAAFAPGFHDGQTPFGVFPAKIETATPGWLRSENDNLDVGAMVLGRNGAGQRVARAVGAVGLETGQSSNQVFDAYGYPGLPPFDPNKEYHCQSPFMGVDPTSLAFPGPPTIRIACDMTQGASGGGWLIGGQYLNGLNSYGYPGQPGSVYGPYFGRAVWRLFRSVRYLTRAPRQSRHLAPR